MEISAEDIPRLIAFYYPQFHECEINNQLYGEGFTEWDNVRRGAPLYPGHRQPRVPSTLGEYRLDDPSVYAAQVALAREAHISGFCFYHYWFSGGMTVLDAPFKAALASDETFPFCLMWANHHWNLSWRGKPHDHVLEMLYAVHDPHLFVTSLASAFLDERYISIDGRPLLLIYDLENPPNLGWLLESLQKAADEILGTPLFIAGVVTEPTAPQLQNPALDALCEFPPHGYRSDDFRLPPIPGSSTGNYFDYGLAAAASVLGTERSSPLPYFTGAMPDWDNSPRRIESRDAIVYPGANPEAFKLWLIGLLAGASEQHQSMPLIFINAWNEWGESAYLEPDHHSGSANLDAARDAVDQFPSWSDEQAANELLARHTTNAVARLQRTSGEDNHQGVGSVWFDRLGSLRGPDTGTYSFVPGLTMIEGFLIDPNHEPAKSSTTTVSFERRADGSTWTVALPPVDRLDLLRSETGLSDDNVRHAGFRSLVDTRPLEIGEYLVRVRNGDAASSRDFTLDIGETAHYPASTPRWRRVFEGSGETHDLQAATPLVLELLELSPGSSVLHTDCGDGAFGHSLQRETGASVHGLAVEPAALTAACEHLASAHQVSFDDPGWLRKIHNRFDLIVLSDALEHMTRPDLALNALRRLLHESGQVLTILSNAEGESPPSLEPHDHGSGVRTIHELRSFTWPIIEQMFQESGFRITAVDAVVPVAAIRRGSDWPASVGQFIVLAEPA